MKIGSPLPRKKARIEIIPLIDIMFFLLVSFMLVSVSMIKMEAIKMDLPVAKQASKAAAIEFLNIDVNQAGDPFIENKLVTALQLQTVLSNKMVLTTNLQVYIRGHKEASHGSVIHILDLVRGQGIQKVSFAVTLEPAKP
jgi:biopolymer transport protein ExbD